MGKFCVLGPFAFLMLCSTALCFAQGQRNIGERYHIIEIISRAAPRICCSSNSYFSAALI